MELKNRAGLRNVRTCSAEQGPPYFIVCQKNFIRSKLPTSKDKENKLVESMHYCNFRQYILVRPACILYCLIVDKN